jgi:hypothetical protein
MSVSFIDEGGGRVTVTVSGQLTAADMIQLERGMAGLPREGLRILIYLRGFAGWENATTTNLDAFGRRDEKIDKLAVVGEEKWKDQVLMFTGAGYRHAQVKFFPLAGIGEANAWLG